MPITDNASIQRAAIQKYKRRVKNELHLDRDFLNAVFMRENLYEKYASCDFVDELAFVDKSSEYNTLFSDGTYPNTSDARRLNTPAGTTPNWRRRLTHMHTRDINVNINRVDAKTRGMSVDALGDLYATKIMAAEKTARTQMQLQFLTDTTSENPSQADFADSSAANGKVAKIFPANNRILARGVKTGSNFNFGLDVGSLIALMAHFRNVLNVGMSLDEKIENSLDSVKMVWILSNTAWADFLLKNEEKLANKEMFGRSYYFEKYGKIQTILGVPVITLPDSLIKPVTTGTASTSGTDISVDFQNNGDGTTKAHFTRGKARATGTSNNNVIRATNLHQSFLVFPSAMYMSKPVQMNTGQIPYKDQDKSLENSIYQQIGMEGMRMYDDPVIQLLFENEFATHTNIAGGSGAPNGS